MQTTVLYSSTEIRTRIIEIFTNPATRRVALVAYVGSGYSSFIPNPAGLELYCAPTPGPTNPKAIEELIRQGAQVFFSPNLHMKVYWAEGRGCVITSANLSTNGLSDAGTLEAGIFLPSTEVDIEKLIAAANATPATPEAIQKLTDATNALPRQPFIITPPSLALSIPTYLEWFNSKPNHPSWKLGTWWGSGKKTAGSTDSIQLSEGQALKDEWLLTFRLGKSRKATQIEWMYIDEIKFHPEDGYTHLALQQKSTYSRLPPFDCSSSAFQTAFQLAIMNDDIHAYIEEDTNLTPPAEMLKSIATTLASPQ